ncbi:MAG: PAS domain S-box protein [Pirellulales bacterium]|nr:PAS domain S-box protein [Pirellulales bacterium]
MNGEPSPDPGVLGQILLLQSTLQAAPDERRLMEMLTHGMTTLPGIVGCVACIEGSTVIIQDGHEIPSFAVCPSTSKNTPVSFSCCADSCPFMSDGDWKRYELHTSHRTYGMIFLNVRDRKYFEPYEAFAGNTANLVALYIENNRSVAELSELNRSLEEEVRERTVQLRESKERYRAVVEDMPALICHFLPGGEITYANDAYCKYFKTTAAELVGSSFLSLIPEADREAVLANISALTVESPTYSHEHTVIAPNREIRWQRWINRAMFDDLGNAIAYQSIGEDITNRKRAERELADTTSFLNTVVDMSPFAMWVSDSKGTIIRTNRSLRETLNLKDEQIIGKYNVLADKNLKKKALSGKVKDVFEKHIPVSFSTPWYVADAGKGDFEGARDLYINASLFPILSTEGKLEHVVCQWVDITDRKRAEEKIQAERNKAQRYLDIAGAIIVAIDNEGRVILLNQKGCDILATTQKEALGKSWFDTFVPSSDRGRTRQCFEDLMAGKIKNFEFFENSVVSQDGKELLIAWHNTLLRDDYGQIIGTLSSGEDITERKRAEVKLRENEEHLRILFKKAADPIYVSNLEGQLLQVNEQACLMTGFTEEELLKKKIADIYAETTTPEQLAEFYSTLSPGQPVSIESRHLRKDGSSFPVESTIARLETPEGSRILGIIRDTTERNRTAREREELIFQLESQNAELERFTYTVSHDLKSPLITIKGYVGMLRQDLAEVMAEPVESDLARIANAADKMDQLLRDILELSRIGRLVNPPVEVSLEKLVHEALELVSVQIKNRGVQVDVSPDLPVVFGDRVRLLEVWQNLIDNAVKYMGDQAKPLIEIGSRIEGNETVCYVRDNGMGIEPPYHEKIFGLFEQLNQQTEGSGIGLSLVKRIVEVHGGHIWVESKGLGHGSTVCFTIVDQCESPNSIRNKPHLETKRTTNKARC